MLKDMSIVALLEEVDSASPAPGGGSVSALVGTLACALARMYGHLSFGKKSYEANAEATKAEFGSAFEEIKSVEDKLLILVDEDTEIFHRFMQAMKLPKTTEQEMVIRSKAMEVATKDAIESPLQMIDLCFEGIQLLHRMIGFGNKSAISDIGVAVACFEACAKGAYLNVIINLSGLHDDELAYVYERKAKMKLEQILSVSFDLYSGVRERIITS